MIIRVQFSVNGNSKDLRHIGNCQSWRLTEFGSPALLH